MICLHARVIENRSDCYAVWVLFILRKMPGRFKDYIAVPKVNGYQSLHTTIIDLVADHLKFRLELNKCTRSLNMVLLPTGAYKRGNFNGVKQTSSNEKLDMVREILELKDETKDAGEFMKSVKVIFSLIEFCFTPKAKCTNFLSSK